MNELFSSAALASQVLFDADMLCGVIYVMKFVWCLHEKNIVNLITRMNIMEMV